MKKIEFDEYTFVLHRDHIEVEISDEDFQLLKNGELLLSEIAYKYVMDYVDNEIIYDEYKFDSYENFKVIE